MQHSVPQINGKPCTIPMSTGDTLFILGANGTGQVQPDAAHLWATPKKCTLDICPPTSIPSCEVSKCLGHERSGDTEEIIRNRWVKPASRWTDNDAAAKPNIAITNLINMMQRQEHHVANLVYRGSSNNASKYADNHKQPLENHKWPSTAV